MTRCSINIPISTGTKSSKFSVVVVVGYSIFGLDKYNFQIPNLVTPTPEIDEA